MLNQRRHLVSGVSVVVWGLFGAYRDVAWYFPTYRKEKANHHNICSVMAFCPHDFTKSTSSKLTASSNKDLNSTLCSLSWITFTGSFCRSLKCFTESLWGGRDWIFFLGVLWPISAGGCINWEKKDHNYIIHTRGGGTLTSPSKELSRSWLLTPYLSYSSVRSFSSTLARDVSGVISAILASLPPTPPERSPFKLELGGGRNRTWLP